MSRELKDVSWEVTWADDEDQGQTVVIYDNLSRDAVCVIEDDFPDKVANAHLIASAPNLLRNIEICRIVMSTIVKHMPGLHTARAAMESCEDAIKKARAGEDI